MIIIINGQGGVGKDELVKYVQSRYQHKKKVFNISTVDKVKESAMLLGWDGETKNDSTRRFLSDLKDLSNKYFEHSKRYVMDFVDSNIDFNSVIFVHSREPEEIKWFCSYFENCTSLLVRRKSIDKITTNHADANVENYKYDYVIENNGTLEEFYEKIDELMGEILK